MQHQRCKPGSQYDWVSQGSEKYEVSPTLKNMISTGNQTPDLLTLSPEPYALSNVLMLTTNENAHKLK